MIFEGHNGRIVVEGDALVLDRAGAQGRSGGEARPRRMPLTSVLGAFLQPPAERRPGYLQLVVEGQPDEELTIAQAVRHPLVVTFTPAQQAGFERLHDWLENGGELVDDEEPAPPPVTTVPAAPPALKAVPAPPPAPEPSPAPSAEPESDVPRPSPTRGSRSGPDEPVFDKREQYDKIAAGLLDGEEIVAVYDAIGVGTGFVGVTNLRMMLQDNSFVGKKIALTSVPYSRITSVSFVSNKSMLGQFASTSSIAVTVGAKTHEVDFRGDEKAQHCHDVILSYMISG